MKQEAFNMSNVEEEQQITIKGAHIKPELHVSLRKETTYHALSIETLAAQCKREIDSYRRGEP